jgi:hypothetical protein
LLVLAAGIALGLVVIDIYNETSQLAIGYSLLTLLLVQAGLLGLSFGITLHAIRAFFVELRRR